MSTTFKNANGRDVVAADTGETVGKVKTFIVDQAATQIVAIKIGGHGKNADVVSWQDVTSFGADAIMVSKHTEESIKDKADYLGARVLTTDGCEIGKVEDVEFDESTGNILNAITKDGVIALSQLRSLGSYALVVNA